VRAPKVGTLSDSFVVGVALTEEMLRASTTNTIVLLEGALITTNEANLPTLIALKGIRINMVVLSWETLYVLQDGITAELWARERSALQVLSE